MCPVSIPRKGRRLVFLAKQQVQLEEFELPDLKEKEVLVGIESSLMSIGTENIAFNRLFDPGTHWDRYVKYPFYPGYSSVGTVLVSRSELLKVGDRVTVRCRHRSHAVCEESQCCVIPDNVPFEQAHWFALAKIAFHGALAADYRLGDTVLVIGAGPIGQMSARWARAAGADSIVVADIAEQRLAIARAGGATAVINKPISVAREDVMIACGNRLPRVVIDSTGNAAVFADALGIAERHGRVVLLGDTGSPANQQLTSDVITRGLSIVGAHDVLNTPQWDNATITRLFLNLAASGRFALDGLNTHFFAPEDCADAYATANRERAKTMGIVFEWKCSA